MESKYELSDEALIWTAEYLSNKCSSNISIKKKSDKYVLKSNDIELNFPISKFKNKTKYVKYVAAENFEIRIYGFDTEIVLNTKSNNTLNIDVISFLFYTINRVEEYYIDEKDVHGRFKYQSSLACKEDFINIPVVDYIVIFIKEKFKLSDSINRDEEEVYLTHDVDRPYMYYFPKFYSLFRFIIGRILKLDLYNIKNYFLYLFGKSEDPYNTFDYLMDISENNNLKSHFYFIPENNSKRYDSDYDIKSNKIKNLIKKINKRNHFIGTHFSYNSKDINNKIENEFNKIKSMCKSNKFNHFVNESRMHYLRWDTWSTAVSLEKAGIKKDFTFGYAELLSFRSGTCHDFRPFCIKLNRKINVVIIPLSIMEGTVWGYMNIKEKNEIYEHMKDHIDLIKDVNGIINILWHNSDITEKWQKNIYEKIVNYAKNN